MARFRAAVEKTAFPWTSFLLLHPVSCQEKRNTSLLVRWTLTRQHKRRPVFMLFNDTRVNPLDTSGRPLWHPSLFVDKILYCFVFPMDLKSWNQTYYLFLYGLLIYQLTCLVSTEKGKDTLFVMWPYLLRGFAFLWMHSMLFWHIHLLHLHVSFFRWSTTWKSFCRQTWDDNNDGALSCLLKVIESFKENAKKKISVLSPKSESKSMMEQSIHVWIEFHGKDLYDNAM